MFIVIYKVFVSKKVLKRETTKGLVRFNNYLSVIVAMAAMYVIITPLLPNLSYRINGLLHIKRPLVRAAITDVGGASNDTIVKDNILVVPSINLQEHIFEGNTEASINLGAWRRPKSSTPNRGSNTVIAGHRFYYSVASVFYNLDKIKVGDPIIVYWEGSKFRYTVNLITIVKPSAVEVESPTKEPVLTLYTCTPLWTARDRLIIRAKLGN